MSRPTVGKHRILYLNFQPVHPSMNPSSSPNLSDDLLRRIDQTCDEFETAWKSGSRPFVDDFLSDFPEQARIVLLKELLPIEIAWRQRSGETPTVDSYLFRFPQLDEHLLRTLLPSTGQDNNKQTQPIEDRPPAAKPSSESDIGNSPEDNKTISLDDLPVETAEFIRDLDTLGILEARQCLPILAAFPPSPEALTKGDTVSALNDNGFLSQWQAERLSDSSPESLVLGDYVLIDPLGKGGMGIVYRARHRRMDRLVALKTLTHQASDSDASVQRFQREVRAAARLSHPNIVAAYDAGEHNDIHYLVMELVDGIDLSRLVRQNGPLSPNTAVDYVRQAALGFAYAHSQGIIHRDIKPQNLLVDRNQHIRILDMGLARLNPAHSASVPSPSDARTELTQSGVIMGTVDFMSPEQATNTRNANEQSDIYSLGCTMYFLLTGRAMFDGETCMERLLAHHQESRPSLTTMVSRIPPALDQVFTRMTARLPAERYRSMEEVVQALDEVKSSGDVSVPVSPSSADVPHPPDVVTDDFRTGIGVNSNGVSAEGSNAGPTVIEEPLAATRLDQPGDFSPDHDTARATSTVNRKNAIRATVVALGLCLAIGITWPLLNDARESQDFSSNGTSQSARHDNSSLKLLTDRQQPDCDWPEASLVQQRQRLVAGDFGITPFVENSLGMVLAVVPASDSGTAPFLVSTTEVTVRQFGSFVDDSGYQLRSTSRWGFKEDRGWVTGDHYNFRNLGDIPVSPHFPASSICWLDAQAFCEWLSQRENARYRLPTVAEWQTANAAGNRSRWFFGSDANRLPEFGWFEANSGQVLHQAGQKRPNALGIFDTLGNEYEWCMGTAASTDTQSPRPQAGGGFGDSPEEIVRRVREPVLTPPDQGQRGAFRVVREL